MQPKPDFYADLTSHHIEGIARVMDERGEDGFFRVPLINHVEGNLWQGGVQDGMRLPDDFAFVISLYDGERYEIGPDTERLFFKLYDSEVIDDIDTIMAIGELAYEASQQGKTLVHCQAGLNRSGLISAIALILGGKTPQEAIALLRSQRSPVVLCNKTFEQFLLTYKHVPQGRIENAGS